uniref:Uncharacterized protein n=1 Tax=Ciona savignyi TaxID=51511 RepID=H2YGP6_CIOSA
MLNGNIDRVKRRTNNNQPDMRSQRRNKRLSTEDVKARNQLWQHIQKDIVETDERLQDISYTEVRTEGSSKPVRLRHHRRRNSGASKRASGASGVSHPLDDGMVSPLPVTTTVMQERVNGGNPRHPRKHAMNDWDTRTSLSVEGFQSTNAQHRRKPDRRKRESNLKLPDMIGSV